MLRSLNDSGEMSLGGPAITVIFMVGAEFGQLGKHFRLRAGARPEDRPSAFLGLSSGRPILTETATRKGLLG